MFTVWERQSTDEEWNFLAMFQFKNDAQAFAERHYDTQTGGDSCDCHGCAEGWRVTEWQSYEVRVSGWTAPCPDCDGGDQHDEKCFLAHRNQWVATN